MHRVCCPGACEVCGGGSGTETGNAGCQDSPFSPCAHYNRNGFCISTFFSMEHFLLTGCCVPDHITQNPSSLNSFQQNHNKQSPLCSPNGFKMAFLYTVNSEK
ncbi:hypothetical protein L596_024660 [Steinernema carpocapsae]|uniref:ShKT domain-containing protein n=1 Tax=Steinernema carpocapsae TaxID=34508 RepID=A0A4U5M5F3_STECR|nr:hypothetical protein L596_024660 [Steinernema carpocapsae]